MLFAVGVMWIFPELKRADKLVIYVWNVYGTEDAFRVIFVQSGGG